MANARSGKGEKRGGSEGGSVSGSHSSREGESHNWIIVFGRPGCGFTSAAVQALVRDGRFPFVYMSMPGQDREKWWSHVQDIAPTVTLPRTFPSVIVWQPKPTVFKSDDLVELLKEKEDLDPKLFSSNLLRNEATERMRTDRRPISQLVKDGVDFVWYP